MHAKSMHKVICTLWEFHPEPEFDWKALSRLHFANVLNAAMMEQTPLEHVVFLNDEYKNMDWTDKNGVTVNQFSSLLSEADSSFLTEMEHRISIQDADEACNIQASIFR